MKEASLELSLETRAAFRELFAALEQQVGPIESFSLCRPSFEDRPHVQRIAGNGSTTRCEVARCTRLALNLCCFCEKALCAEHSHPTVSDGGQDAYACTGCFYDLADEDE